MTRIRNRKIPMFLFIAVFLVLMWGFDWGKIFLLNSLLAAVFLDP